MEMRNEPSDRHEAQPSEWVALARYLTGESDPAEATRVREWLAAAPGRAERISALDASLNTIATRLAAVDVERALSIIHGRMLAPKPVVVRSIRNHGWSSPSLLRRAAAIAIMIGGAAVWYGTSQLRNAHALRVVASGTVSAPVGQRDSLQLPDGSRVVLGPGSTLQIAEGYGKTGRELSLTGEGYFDVRHEGKPFTVRAGSATIVDVGTRFGVQSTEGTAVRVAVKTGAVRVSSPTVTGEGTLLREGDRGTVDSAGKITAERNTLSDDDLAWTTGKLVFREASMAQVAADLRRWYGVELRLANEALADRHLTASFTTESREDVLRIIGLTLGASIERHGDTAVVRSRNTN
jgi:transmembrane sensor